jgi:hypothetical protein
VGGGGCWVQGLLHSITVNLSTSPVKYGGTELFDIGLRFFLIGIFPY